jgi:hypothetical protein
VRTTPIAVFAIVVGLCAGAKVGYEYGRYTEGLMELEQRYKKEQNLVDPVLAADPAFKRIATLNFPVAGLCLQGPLQTQDDFDLLRTEVIRLFGEPRSAHIMQDVHVEKLPPDAVSDG